MFTSILSARTEPGYPASSDSQDLGLLYDPYGAPLLNQIYYPTEQLLYVRWFGNLTAKSVIAGAHAVLESQRKLHFPLLLNDKQDSTGDWSEAMEWLEYEWLPQAHQLGLRAFAYVFAPDLNNQLVSLDFVTRTNQLLSAQVFYDTGIAWTWLSGQRRLLRG